MISQMDSKIRITVSVTQHRMLVYLQEHKYAYKSKLCRLFDSSVGHITPRQIADREIIDRMHAAGLIQKGLNGRYSVTRKGLWVRFHARMVCDDHYELPPHECYRYDTSKCWKHSQVDKNGRSYIVKSVKYHWMDGIVKERSPRFTDNEECGGMVDDIDCASERCSIELMRAVERSW